MFPLDVMPDYDLLRLQAKERAYDEAERRAHEDEVADGLQSEPNDAPFDWAQEEVPA